jgi:hypothetical protein
MSGAHQGDTGSRPNAGPETFHPLFQNGEVWDSHLSFEGRSSGVGPTLSFMKQTTKVMVAAQVRRLPELSVENRMKGDCVRAKLALIL